MGNNGLTDEAKGMLKQMALQQLVTSTALMQAAQKSDLRFTQKQVGGVIAGISAFQENGFFSQKKFHEVLGNLGFSENDFFNNVRNAMLINQLRVGLIGSSFSLPSEVKQAVQLVNQKRDILYTMIPVRMFMGKVHLTDAEIEQYYQANQADYTLPQMVTLQYVELSLPEWMKKNHESDAQKASQEFSNAIDQLNNLTYTNPQTLEPAAKALGLTLQSSAPLVEGQKAEGVFAADALKNVAFSKDVLEGNNSALINLDDQHVVVVRALKIQAAHVKPLAEVRTLVVRALTDQKTKSMATELAQKIVADVSATKTLQEAAGAQHLSAIQENSIGRYTSGKENAINNIAFQLPVPNVQPSVSFFPLPSGDVAVVQVLKVLTAPSDIPKVQERVMDQQIGTAYAQMDYQAYVARVLSNASIHVAAADAGKNA